MKMKKEQFVLEKSMEPDGHQAWQSGAASSRARSRGQGMTEYIVIVALVALGAIGAYQAFGKVVQGRTGEMANSLAGNDNGGGSAATTTEGAQSADAQKGKTLKDFTTVTK